MPVEAKLQSERRKSGAFRIRRQLKTLLDKSHNEKKQSYHSQKIEVMKTTAKDVGFFPLITREPRALPNRKLKAEGNRARRADTSQFLGHQKWARRPAEPSP